MAFRRKFSSTTPVLTTPPAFRHQGPAPCRTRLGATAGAAVIAAAATATMVLGAAFAAGASASTTVRTAAHSAAGKQVGIADPDLITKPAQVQASELAAMKAIGITSIRLDADWSIVQHAGARSFSWGQLDRAVTSVRAAGMTVDLIIDGTPAWAAKAGTSGDVSPPPASPAQYATFAARVAARYAPHGVKLFEIWNEPNSAGFWSPKPDPAAYTADLKAAHAAIKRAEPSALVISGGLAPETNDGTNIAPITFLQDMYADGAKGSFNAVGYHPYSYPALPDTYEIWSGWSQMSQTPTSIESVMAANGNASVPLWLTEVGAPTNGPDGVGTAAQAEDLTQAIANAKTTSSVAALYIYTYEDSGTDTSTDEDWFGLLTASGAENPSYAAVAAALK
jgi:hypothetical protein